MVTMFRDESSTFVPQNIGILLTLLFFTYVLLSALFFTFLVRYLTGNVVSDRVPTVVSIVALTVASLPIGLVPIDVFIVGYMKNSSGQFQPWAIDSRDRHDFSTTLLCAYYASYIATLFTTFVIIPLAYFFHKTETASSGRSRQNILPALCYTGLCIMILIILLSIGGVVPTREFPTPNSTLEEQFHIMLDDLKTSELEDMFSFALSAIRIVGLALITTYVGIGMVLGPINHIRGYPDPRTELAGVRNRRTGIQIEISSIQQNRIVISALTCILRAMFSWGEHVGYLMPNVKVLNPLDRLSLFIQRVFPLDFILLIFLVTFLILAATSGFQKVGLGIPWIKTYKIKPWKTKSRSLLVFTANLILILLSVDILLLNLLPQYTTFSSQRYIACAENKTLQYPLLPTPLPDSAKEEKVHSLSHSSPKDDCDESLVLPCDWTAPEGQCVMTRISVLWARVCYKTWYFGAMFYCITWIFLVVVVLEGCIATFRPSRRSNSAMILPDLESS
ncbi:hypothetical protein DAPPUDRAFT_105179 [Daphnia pulex]|uniref:Lysosomal cobalamin transporter n=1 Tax=Daphnia pulex TaxID=6669 RepID=E9GPQ7_DAPPU|nr:hypothetical protein DAPPUDRAFT_105179 [Daphnia pulex]|eukprot:EFX78429.1 hypothetical protein DAPPUDRAFT_105179 [Daphnia pulex]